MKLTGSPRTVSRVKSALLGGRPRTLFLRWLLLNVFAVGFLAKMGLSYGGRIHGPSLIAIPVILFTFTHATRLAGLICWRSDDPLSLKTKLLHDLKYVRHWAEQIQYMAMLSTIFGIWVLLTDKGGNLHDRLLNGGGVAFSGTFVGIFASFILMQSQRMIEDELDR